MEDSDVLRILLMERVKELQCIYSLAELAEDNDLALEEVLQRTVEIIPQAWRYPEIASARVVLDSEVFRSSRFQETDWKLVSPILLNQSQAGKIEVCYSREEPFLEEEKRLIDAIARLLGQVVDRRRTEKDLRAYQHQLRSLASELSLAEQRERLAIATYLHDQIAQSLAMAKIKLGGLGKKLPARMAKELEEVRKLLEETINATRSLCFDLAPPILYELGLGAAVEWLAERIQERHGIQIDCVPGKKGAPLSSGLMILLFSMVRELLLNVVKHAQAGSAKVTIEQNEEKIDILVEDDGKGFDPEKTVFKPAEGGFGLFSIRERIRYLGGDLNIDSTPGKGSRVWLSAPLKNP